MVRKKNKFLSVLRCVGALITAVFILVCSCIPLVHAADIGNGTSADVYYASVPWDRVHLTALSSGYELIFEFPVSFTFSPSYGNGDVLFSLEAKNNADYKLRAVETSYGLDFTVYSWDGARPDSDFEWEFLGDTRFYIYPYDRFYISNISAYEVIEKCDYGRLHRDFSKGNVRFQTFMSSKTLSNSDPAASTKLPASGNPGISGGYNSSWIQTSYSLKLTPFSNQNDNFAISFNFVQKNPSDLRSWFNSIYYDIEDGGLDQEVTILDWAAGVLQNFLNVQIIPGFSFGTILSVCVGIGLAFWFLKLFAGG